MSDQTPSELDQTPSESPEFYNETEISEILKSVPGLETLYAVGCGHRPSPLECSSIKDSYLQWMYTGYKFIGGYEDGSVMAYNPEIRNLIICFNKKPHENALDNKVIHVAYPDLLKGMGLKDPDNDYQKLTVGAIHCANSRTEMSGMTLARTAPAALRILLQQGDFWSFTASEEIFKSCTGFMGNALNVVDSNNPLIAKHIMEQYKMHMREQENPNLSVFFESISHLRSPEGKLIRVSIRNKKNYGEG